MAKGKNFSNLNYRIDRIFFLDLPTPDLVSEPQVNVLKKEQKIMLFFFIY